MTERNLRAHNVMGWFQRRSHLSNKYGAEEAKGRQQVKIRELQKKEEEKKAKKRERDEAAPKKRKKAKKRERDEGDV